MRPKCSLCPNEADLEHVSNPAIRVCAYCRVRMVTEIPVVCSGCHTLYWIPKSPQNVMTASKLTGIPPKEIMENTVLHSIQSCKGCSSQPALDLAMTGPITTYH